MAAALQLLLADAFAGDLMPFTEPSLTTPANHSWALSSNSYWYSGPSRDSVLQSGDLGLRATRLLAVLGTWADPQMLLSLNSMKSESWKPTCSIPGFLGVCGLGLGRFPSCSMSVEILLF